MRKKTVKCVADTIFWYLLYFLPVVCYVAYMIAEPSSGTTIVQFGDFMTRAGFGILADNVVFDTLDKLLGQGGVLPLFSNETPMQFLAYFVSVYLAHLIIDFVLFIPRLCHKWLNEFTKGDC